MRLRLTPVPFAIALCGAWLAGCASTGAGPAARADAAIVVPFTLSAQNNIVIEARINGSGPLKLMLHTASAEVTLTEDAVRRIGGIDFAHGASVESWGGTSEARYSTGNRVRIGALTREGVTVWENRNSGDGTDGKFGLDVFAGRAVEIDFDAARIVLHPRVPNKARGYDRIRIRNEDGQLFVEGVCLFGGARRAHRFLIHSGYGGGLLLDDAFAASSGIEGRIAITDTTALTDSFGHAIAVKKGVMPGLRLGRSRLSDVPVGFFSGAIGQQKTSVLGGAVRKRFNLILDAPRTTLYLMPRDARAKAGAAPSATPTP